MLEKVFPEYGWQIWKFPRRTARIWSDPNALNAVLSRIESELRISTPKDWYRVTREQLQSLSLARVFSSGQRGLAVALKARYPGVEWDESLFYGRAGRVTAQKEK